VWCSEEDDKEIIQKKKKTVDQNPEPRTVTSGLGLHETFKSFHEGLEVQNTRYIPGILQIIYTSTT
jgi:hypothetical protein